MPPLPNTRPRSFSTFRAIAALILREMSTTYGRSPGGFIWAILEPVAALLVLSFAFSLIQRTPSLGTVFMLFYATGYLPFNFYSSIQGSVSRSIRFSRSLLFYPAVTWVDAIAARFILNTATNILVATCVFAGIYIYYGLNTHISFEYVVLSMALSALLGLGIGTLNCYLLETFPVYEQFWNILTRPLFLASGIIFTFDDMPRFAQDILWWNPLIHVVGLMRQAFYPYYDASYVSVTYVAIVSMVTLTLGLVLVRANYQTMVNR